MRQNVMGRGGGCAMKSRVEVGVRHEVTGRGGGCAMKS